MSCKRFENKNVKKNISLTLFLSLFGFGLDRFYCNEPDIGLGLLILSMSIIGLPLIVIIQLMSQISLLITIFLNKNKSIAYPHVTFKSITSFDRFFGILYLFAVITLIILFSVFVNYKP